MSETNTSYEASASYKKLHQQAFELLPWYVNETLRGADLEFVSQHLASCVVCRKEIDEQRALRSAMAPTLVEPPSADAAFERLVDQIESSSSPTKQWTRFARPRTLFGGRKMLAQAAAALLLLATGFGLGAKTSEPTFRTRSTDRTVVGRAGEGLEPVEIRIRFDGDLRISELSKVLSEFDLDLVAGPSPRGVCTLHWRGAQRAGAMGSSVSMELQAEEVVERLRLQVGIPFAEVVAR